MTLYCPIRSCQRSASNPRGEGRETGLWILQGWYSLAVQSLIFYAATEGLGPFSVPAQAWCRQSSRSLHSWMVLGIPTLGEKEDVSVSWTKHSCFLKGREKINGYLQFVETQSIPRGSYPLNGDEGTITEYGHFRVTADLGRWSLVWGVCLGSWVFGCVLISFILCVRTWAPSQRKKSNHTSMAA